MLVTEYLKDCGLEKLQEELGIEACHHDRLPLVILNYNQINSPKTHPIVRECRGLVLDKRDWSLVARSFPRFFNWGEVPEEMKDFDFSDFCVQTKEDGSLVLVFNFEGEWLVTTRGSFADGPLKGSGGTWRMAILEGMNCPANLSESLDEETCYVGEFCSPWNKVVRQYHESSIKLLTAYLGENELLDSEMARHWWSGAIRVFSGVERHEFKNIEEIQAFLQQQSRDDPTFEGVVIKDRHGHRWKIKSPTYLGLHRLRGEGDNIYNPKNLLPFILTGEEDELLTYFPEVKPAFHEVKAKVSAAYSGLLETWGDYKHIPDQKEFALSIKEHPFKAVLFNVRKKHGQEQRSHHVRDEWHKSSHIILKTLFK